VKYAFYQVFGYSIFRAHGFSASSATILSSAIGGFIGGAIFTVPYLILLFFKYEQVPFRLLLPRNIYSEFGQGNDV
jgi:hypothetical protein